MYLKNKKSNGHTLIEILVAIAVLVILSSIIVVNYNSSNKMSKLRLATEKLATDLRYLQSLALSNVKLIDVVELIAVGGESSYYVERGYNYTFEKEQTTFSWEIILSTSEGATFPGPDISSQDLSSIESKNYSYPEIELNKIEVDGAEKINIKINFLFPEADTYILETLSGSGDSCYSAGQFTCNELILYLKHDEINTKQGKVTINRLSGMVSSEIVD